MKKILALICSIALSALLTGFGCSEKPEETAEVAADPAADTQAPATSTVPARRVKGARRTPVNNVRRNAQVPGAGGDIHMQADMHVEQHRHTDTSVSIQNTVNIKGAGLKLQIQIPDDHMQPPIEPAPAYPAARPRRGRATCKSVLLAKGHSASSLIHCDDVNEACAVALLRAGHSPAQLVHCSDVADIHCALQILRSGRAPSQIVHCD